MRRTGNKNDTAIIDPSILIALSLPIIGHRISRETVCPKNSSRLYHPCTNTTVDYLFCWLNELSRNRTSLLGMDLNKLIIRLNFRTQANNVVNIAHEVI